MNKKIRLIISSGLIILLIAVAFIFFKPRAIEVEMVKVNRGVFTDEIHADGFFRAKNRYTVTAFGEGDIKRVDLKVGDILKKNQTITQLYWDVKYVPVRSPIAGVITKVFRESAGPIHRGEPIIEVVDSSDLEIVSELLTTDAAKVKVGNLAFATGWGDSKPIQAHVTKISKAGFIKISALGVEEERTEVIMEPEKLSLDEKTKLGHTFHTILSIQVATVDAALKIPAGALFRDGSAWAVYQVINGKAQLKHVTISLRGNEEAIIVGGLQEGDIVINYPGDLIKNGTSVKSKKD
ncbi:MAG: HlyD family efflux transporter periplasmic adaptor subunit [Bacteriovorax sp.]|nr:HlyD family efflux transporter periplasmic adaptor subunit [Bacteriovorax sp.]